MAITVADLVATLRLDDQMSPALSKAGQNVENAGAAGRRALGAGALALGAALAVPVNRGLNLATDYNQAIADIFAVGGDEARRSADAITEAIKDQAGESRYGLLETADAFGVLQKAGLDTADIVGGALEAALDLAAAGDTDPALAAEAIAAAMSAYSLEGEEATRVADMFAGAANASLADISDLARGGAQVAGVMAALGVPMDEYITQLSLMTDKGLSGSDAATSLKTAMTQLISPIGEGAKELNKLGLDLFDASGEFIGIHETAEQLIDTFDALGYSEADQVGSLKRLVGQDGFRALLFAMEEVRDEQTGGTKGWDEYARAVNDVGAADEIAAARMDSLSGAREQLNGAFDNLKVELFTPAVEGMIEPTKKAAKFVDQLAEHVGDLPKPVRQAAVGMASMAAGLSGIGGAALFASPHLRAMGQSFQQMKAAPGIIGGIARGAGLLLRLAGPVGLLASAGLAAYGTNFLGFADLVNRGAERIQQALPATQAALADFADEVTTRGGALIDAVRAGDWDAAGSIIQDSLGAASTWAQEQLNRAGSLFEGIDLSGLLSLDDVSLANIAANGQQIGHSIGQALVGGLQGAGGLKDWLQTELPKHLGDVKSVLAGMWTDLMSPVDSMGGPGERGEAFGAEASIIHGFKALMQSVTKGIGAEFEAAFASGALPTPNSDFIVKPIQQMLENAKTGIVGALDGFRHFLGEQIRNLLEVLDQFPGVDMSADIEAMNRALDTLEEAAFGMSERRADLLAEVVTGAGLGNYQPGQEYTVPAVLDAERQAVEAALWKLEGSYDAVEASRAAINDIVGTPLAPQGQPLAEKAADILLPDSGYFEGKAQGAESAGTAALIAEQNMIQEQLATLGAEYAETQAAAEATQQANAAARTVYNNLVSSGGWGDAGNASAAADLPRRIQEPGAPAADPVVTALPQVGGGPAAGADIAAQVQSQLAAAQQALTSGLAQLQASVSSGIQGIVTAFQTGMATAAAAAASGAAAILAPLQALPGQIAAVAGAAAAAAGSIGDAIVQELQADVGAVQAAAQQLAAAAEVGIDAAIQPGSPSRMAIPYGQSVGDGLIYGMQQKSPEVQAAAEMLGLDAEEGLSSLLGSASPASQAAAKALGVDFEQALAEEINGMSVWEPKDQIDPMWMPTFDKAAKVLTNYGKRTGDEAASKAADAFTGLAGAIGDVLGGSAQYLSEESAKAALKSYRRLDADAKKKLPDGTKEMLKAAFDEANVTIGDVIKQRMGGRLGEMGGVGGRFKSQRDTILRAMMGQRTIEQKAQAAAEDGLGLVIDAFKNGLMSAAPSAEGAAESAMQSALGGIGGPGEAMKSGMLASMFGGGAGGDAEEFAWALCECMSGANREMLGELGLGSTAENGVAMLGHDLENAIAGTGNDFRQQMIDYANANPALGHNASWLGDSASCVSICDQAASEMGDAAGQAAGSAMGANMPAMPKAADIGGAAGAALGDQMGAQCVNLCGGTTDDLAGGVSEGIKGASLGEMAVKEVTADFSTGGARELGKQLRGALGAPSAQLPGDTPLSADGLAEQVSGGLTQDCITLCDDAGMSDAAGAMGSAAQDMGGAINSLVNSMVGQKFQETLSGIQQGLQGMSGGGGETPGIPSGVEVPDLIKRLNPNIDRALNFDLASTNPHAAGLLGFGPLGGGGSTPVHLSVTMEMDGQAVGQAVAKGMIGPLQQAASNRRRGAGLTVRK